MLPVSCQEQAVLVPYPRAMGSLIQSEIKQNDIYNGMESHSWLKKNNFSESAHQKLWNPPNYATYKCYLKIPQKF